MKVSPTEAAELAGVSRTTLYRDMKSGKVSADKSENRKSKIDVSELERVYGTLNIEATDESLASVNQVTDETELGRQPVTDELDHLRQQLQTINLEREREREQLLEQISHLKELVDKAGAERSKLTAVITDQRSLHDKQSKKQSEQSAEVDVLKKQMARLVRHNRRIEQELSKSWFQKLFG